MNQTYEESKTKPHKINLERNQIVRLPEKKNPRDLNKSLCLVNW